MKLSIDLGGTNIRIAQVEKGNCLNKVSAPCLAQQDASTVLNQLSRLIRNMMNEQVDGIGIGVPSIVDQLYIRMKQRSYYADGVHPAHNSRSTYARTEKDEELSQPTVNGHERVDINGLPNAYDVTDVTARDCDSVNAQSARALHEAALEKHPEASKIYVISDNARHYRNKELQEWAKGTKIIPLFLPPCSPNLNLTERLWKFLRKKAINAGFYRTEGEFRKAIRNFFDRIGGYKEELEKLLTLNFRLINSKTISI